MCEAQDIALQDPSVILIGEGVPDPKRIFGSTKGLKEKYPTQVYDQPVSEAGVTGICIGAAINGLRPIMTHQRIDFSMYAMDQFANNAAKWYSMFGGNSHSVPMVVRMVIGRGWGQGNQHSQNLSALYAHIPGLKVVMPSNPYSAKGLFLQAVDDPNPVVFIEHRWVHGTKADVPENRYVSEYIPLVLEPGSDITIISWGFALHECLLAAKYLNTQDIYPEVIDLQCLNPINYDPLLASVDKTGRLLVVDDAWDNGSLAHTIASNISQMCTLSTLKWAAETLTLPDFPCPSTGALAQHYYNGPVEIYSQVASMLGLDTMSELLVNEVSLRTHDVDPFVGKVTSAI